VSDFVLDASLALQWFLEDEAGRQYSLKILDCLTARRAAVPALWPYEVGNGLLMAHLRKRITIEQIDGFLTRLKALPIDIAPEGRADTLALPALALKHGLTNYDAAYLALALRLALPLATTDADLLRAATAAGVQVLAI